MQGVNYIPIANYAPQLPVGQLLLACNGIQWALVRVVRNITQGEGFLRASVIEIVETIRPFAEGETGWEKGATHRMPYHQLYFNGTLGETETTATNWWNTKTAPLIRPPLNTPAFAYYEAVYIYHESDKSAFAAAMLAGALWSSL